MGKCPRCGLPGSPYKAEVGNKTYLYYAHRVPGEKKRRICYIGPTDGYDLVARMYNIDIQHAFDLKHRLQVFTSLLSFFVHICEESEEDVCREFRARLRRALEEIERGGNDG